MRRRMKQRRRPQWEALLIRKIPGHFDRLKLDDDRSGAVRRLQDLAMMVPRPSLATHLRLAPVLCFLSMGRLLHSRPKLMLWADTRNIQRSGAMNG